MKLVQGDLNDAKSYESALQGVDGMFLNADCESLILYVLTQPVWVSYKGNNSDEARDIEIKQGKDAVDAAKRAGVKFIVYSALERCKPSVPHFDSKAEVVDYIKQSGIPASNVYPAYYWTNLLSAKTADKDGKTVIDIPLPDDTVIPGFNPNQIGLWARVAFRDPKAWAGEWLTLHQRKADTRQGH